MDTDRRSFSDPLFVERIGSKYNGFRIPVFFRNIDFRKSSNPVNLIFIISLPVLIYINYRETIANTGQDLCDKRSEVVITKQNELVIIRTNSRVKYLL